MLIECTKSVKYETAMNVLNNFVKFTDNYRYFNQSIQRVQM